MSEQVFPPRPRQLEWSCTGSGSCTTRPRGGGSQEQEKLNSSSVPPSQHVGSGALKVNVEDSQCFLPSWNDTETRTQSDRRHFDCQYIHHDGQPLRKALNDER